MQGQPTNVVLSTHCFNFFYIITLATSLFITQGLNAATPSEFSIDNSCRAPAAVPTYIQWSSTLYFYRNYAGFLGAPSVISLART